MTDLRQTAVELNNISKVYTLHHEKPTFSEQIIRRTSKEKFKALKNVTVKIYQGEKVGVVGSNGSGKTTFLKIIAGITTQTSGIVRKNGKIVSLIELTAGFHPELSGEENIFLNGMVIGMSRDEIKEKFKEIVEFADIGKFIDSPLYTYSDGMKLRLGFSIAINSDPDILILDEGITVGDQDFIKKSERKIEEFFKKNKTIILVTHWLEYLKENTNRVLWLDGGKLKADGGHEVIDEYLASIGN